MGKGDWHGVGKSDGESASGADGGVVRGYFGNGTIMGKKINSFDDAFSSGFQDVHSVAPIVIKGATYVLTGDAME